MNEFLEFLKKFAGTFNDEESGKVAEALKSNSLTQPLFQWIFNSGHKAAYADAKKKEKELSDEVARVNKKLEETQAEFDEHRAKAPDVKAVEDRYKAEIAKLENEKKTLKENYKKEKVEWFIDRAAKDAVIELADLGVDPEWAEYLMTKPENRDRLRVTDGADGKPTVEVLKSGSEIALQAENPLKALAAELRKDVKPIYITSKADKGSGERAGGGTGTSVFDKVREDAKKDLSSTARPEGFKSAAERLGSI